MLLIYPKIFPINDPHITSIWNEIVEITEEIDGSQLVFGVIKGALYIRTKEAFIYSKDAFIEFVKASELYAPGVRHIVDLFYAKRLPEGYTFFAETVAKFRHKLTTYEKVPTNNLVLFSIRSPEGYYCSFHSKLKTYAKQLDIDVVPLLFKGKIVQGEKEKLLERLLKTKSYLGKADVAGLVVKNYKEYMVMGRVIPVMTGIIKNNKMVLVTSKKSKYVEVEKDLEVKKKWYKAFQNLDEQGILQYNSHDIGPLIKEVIRNIRNDEKEAIKEMLWKKHIRTILKKNVVNLSKWYRNKLNELKNDA